MSYKFRLWDNENLCFFKQSAFISEWPVIHENGTLVFIDGFGGYRKADQDKYVVQQFTGLKDSKGVDIFEGDILKSTIDGKLMTVKQGWYRQSEGIESNDEILYEIHTSHVGFFVEWKEDGEEYQSTLACTSSNSEIFGHIFL